MSICPATMCPLTSPNGSPWTGEKNATCPQHDTGYDPATDRHTRPGGCSWWNEVGEHVQRAGCNGCNAAHEQIGAALEGDPIPVAGPRRPKRYDTKPAARVTDYDCPRAAECQWQIEAEQEGGLCPPRSALRLGLDPRVCLW